MLYLRKMASYPSLVWSRKVATFGIAGSPHVNWRSQGARVDVSVYHLVAVLFQLVLFLLGRRHLRPIVVAGTTKI